MFRTPHLLPRKGERGIASPLHPIWWALLGVCVRPRPRVRGRTQRSQRVRCLRALRRLLACSLVVEHRVRAACAAVCFRCLSAASAVRSLGLFAKKKSGNLDGPKLPGFALRVSWRLGFLDAVHEGLELARARRVSQLA